MKHTLTPAKTKKKGPKTETASKKYIAVYNFHLEKGKEIKREMDNMFEQWVRSKP